MALTKCPECSGQVSTEAESCPHCGYQIKQKHEEKLKDKQKEGCLGCLSIALFIAMAWMFFDGGVDNPKPKPERHSTPSSLSAKAWLGTNAISIENTDAFQWTDVTIEVNGGLISGGFWKHLDWIHPGQKVRIPTSEFAKSDGTRLNLLTTKANSIQVTAKINGSSVIWLGRLD